MKDKKAFTLIEMLMVLVLMGLILTIGIPAVMRIVENKSNEQYQAQIKVADKAVDLYTLRYQGDLKEYNEASCFILNYQELLNEDLLNEEDIKCTGNIILTRKKNNSYKKDYYLNCIDSTNNKELSNNTTPSNSCINLSTLEDKVESNVVAPTIKGENKNWVSTNITISIDQSGTPTSDILRYEYYTSSKPETPSRNVVVTGTKTVSNNSLTISANGTTYIWYRVVNKKNEVSNWSNRQEANIDNTTPSTPTITASDGKGSGIAHTSEFALNFGGANSISGSTYYYGFSSTTVTTVASSIKVDTTLNGKTIYVKVCSGANKCSGSASYKIVLQ